MNNLEKNILGIFVITIFYSLFAIPSFIRIKKALRDIKLFDSDKKKISKIKNIVDIVINIVVIIGAILLYLLLLLGILLPR